MDIPVHPEKVSACMRTHFLLQVVRYTESLHLLITTQTPESCPKHTVLHGTGLPATADIDIAKVKAKKAKVELAVTGNRI